MNVTQYLVTPNRDAIIGMDSLVEERPRWLINNGTTDAEPKQVYICIFSVILVVGVVCNVLIFLTMRLMPKQTSTTTYFKCLALMDVINVLYDAGFRGIVLIGFGFQITNDVCCRLDWWFDRWTTTFSAWGLAALAMDRVLCLRRPLWHRSHVTIARTYLVCLAMVAMQMLLFLPMLVLWDTSSGRCDVSVHFSRRVADGYSIWITYLDVTVLPAVLIAASNAAIVYTVYHTRRYTRVLSGGPPDQTGGHSGSLIGPLLGASVFFVVVTIVFSVFQQLRTVTPEDDPKYDFYASGQKMAISINESCNFFVYGLTSKLFRDSLRKLLRLQPTEKDTPTNAAESDVTK